MFDKEKFADALACYKRDFEEKQWPEEKYKWEAVKQFQDNWDINASDFVDMLKRSLAKTANLLASTSFYPRKMITMFAELAPEETKAMFIDLFDEDKDIIERINRFKDKSNNLLQEKTSEGSDYQNENAITTYLWLRYPDKYYIYKYSVAKDVFETLDVPSKIKKGKYPDNLRNSMAIYDDICDLLSKDTEIVSKLNNLLTESCYHDPAYKTLTIDFGYYISKRYGKEEVTSSTEDENEAHNDEIKDSYSEEDFLDEVYMTEADYCRLKAILEKKKNIILQGAPGVGKTFVAKRLAYSLIGEKDDDRIEFVQFHQNYSYEDFVMGLKPEGETFALKHGTFYRFCRKAICHPEKNYYMIIDEINRGNLSKIFGELLMLIENNYRGEDNAITLAYIDQKFYVPENLYIIGMMNTADRSLAMIDYALRRRFSFFKMKPGFNTEGFRNYQNSLNNEMLDTLINKVIELNHKIENDKTLGPGFCIGHSYFCNLDTSCGIDDLKDIVDYDIMPTLEEYWFDDENTLLAWDNELHGIFQ